MSKNPIAVKLFIGTAFNAELKSLMSQNSEWQRDKVTNQNEGLSIVRFQDRDYIGISKEEDHLSLEAISQTEKLVRSALQKYFPEYDFDSLKYVVFPRVFIS